MIGESPEVVLKREDNLECPTDPFPNEKSHSICDLDSVYPNTVLRVETATEPVISTATSSEVMSRDSRALFMSP